MNALRVAENQINQVRVQIVKVEINIMGRLNRMEYDCDICGCPTDNISTCDNCQDDNLCRKCGTFLEDVEIKGEPVALCDICNKDLYEKYKLKASRIDWVVYIHSIMSALIKSYKPKVTVQV